MDVVEGIIFVEHNGEPKRVNLAGVLVIEAQLQGVLHLPTTRFKFRGSGILRLVAAQHNEEAARKSDQREVSHQAGGLLDEPWSFGGGPSPRGLPPPR